ncbi:MAG: DUF6580 family putative transport protein [Terriglobales bacterium]|jgi:hypothetical protein
MLAYLFVVVAVAVRFLPHPWTFTPLAASLLYFGARMPRRQWWIPLALLIGSDILLTRMTYGYSIPPDHIITWIWYGLMLCVGGLLCQDAKPFRIAAASVIAAVSFFLISNFGVWAEWNMYPKTPAGLMACYAAAVPFARNFISDPLFSGIFFGIGALVATRVHKENDLAAN